MESEGLQFGNPGQIKDWIGKPQYNCGLEVIVNPSCFLMNNILNNGNIVEIQEGFSLFVCDNIIYFSQVLSKNNVQLTESQRGVLSMKMNILYVFNKPTIVFLTASISQVLTGIDRIDSVII